MTSSSSSVPRFWYTATERFGPPNGDSWTKYIQWSRLTQLEEVVSLDGMLCQPVVRKLTEEDWEHNVREDYRTSYFLDLSYLLTRLGERAKLVNVLAVVLEPDREMAGMMPAPGAVFCGYDLVEHCGSTSALTNCSGFDDVFVPAELSTCGLLTAYSRASEVRDKLLARHPDEPHADCELWALWRFRLPE